MIFQSPSVAWLIIIIFEYGTYAYGKLGIYVVFLENVEKSP